MSARRGARRNNVEDIQVELHEVHVGERRHQTHVFDDLLRQTLQNPVQEEDHEDFRDDTTAADTAPAPDGGFSQVIEPQPALHADKFDPAASSVQLGVRGSWVTLSKEATPNGLVLKATRRSPIIGPDSLPLHTPGSWLHQDGPERTVHKVEPPTLRHATHYERVTWLATELPPPRQEGQPKKKKKRVSHVVVWLVGWSVVCLFVFFCVLVC